jgi:sec-independent protein translocase protein TatA
MSNLGTPELIILGIIVVWLFGTDKLKELARGIGKSTKELKEIKKELENPDGDKQSTGTS